MNKNKESLHLSSPAINTHMNKRSQIWAAFRSAFPYTIPIFAGFLFLGIAYGIFMHSLGFSAIYPIIMSFMIFVLNGVCCSEFFTWCVQPYECSFLTLMVNARHLFYGISMLDKYRGTGKKKLYLIFGMCDESFSINYTANVPANVDKGWFMFFVTLLNHLYWVAGAAIGGIFGSYVKFNTEGLDFVMTALFIVIFIEQWMKEKKHYSALSGLGLSVACLILFGGNQFIIPAMLAILGVLTVLRKPLEKAEVSV